MINFEQFADFLKKYSTIPNSFIDDFFTFYSYNTTDEHIIINHELVAKWLNTSRGELKKLLYVRILKILIIQLVLINLD